MGESWCGLLNVYGFFSLFFDSILDFSGVCGGVRGKVNSEFDRARRVLSWSLLLRLWSPFWANPSGKYTNPDPGYPTFITTILFHEMNKIDMIYIYMSQANLNFRQNWLYFWRFYRF